MNLWPWPVPERVDGCPGMRRDEPFSFDLMRYERQLPRHAPG